VGLSEDLGRIATVALTFADVEEKLAAVIPAEPADGARTYLCAYVRDGRRRWLAFDDRGEPVTSRAVVREAVSIAAMCELAEETAAGGDLDELRAQLVAVRVTESPPGIDEAEEAVAALQRAVGRPPRLATPAYLDSVGAATVRLERALGESAASPFVAALRAAAGAVEELVREVETGYKEPLA
jgi:hypothetical protein